jgi:hypothetical protein
MRVTIARAAPSFGFTFTASTNFRRACALSGDPDKAHYLESDAIQSECVEGLYRAVNRSRRT